MEFTSAYDQGFARVAACTLPIALADPGVNVATVLEQARACHEEGVAVAVFPELCLTGYSLDDLFLQDALLDATTAAIEQLVEGSADLGPVIVVGAPLRQDSRLYNCAVVVHRGSILGVVPKVHLPNYREFYEERWFASGADHAGTTIDLGPFAGVPFGTGLLFRASDIEGLTLGVEICEDVWVPVPPSSELALLGATVLANLSASPVTVGRADDRRLMVKSQSSRCRAAYVYTAAGPGESSTDLAWDAQTMIYECGEL
ncbi:MAG: nitrilase-related carbon-nitrogen hydrolase, partial [Marmoricola sp.]